MNSMPKLDYLDWNELIARKFFNSEMAGHEVLLYVTDDIINQLGYEFGEGCENFISCVKKGPSCSKRLGICQKALECYEEWRDIRQGYPTYIAYLALFVLAATRSGDFDSKSYYQKLWQILGETPRIGYFPSFEKMDKLWENLERWSKAYKQEELGCFTKRIRGGYVHVGLPLSQTILSEDERKALPQIFSEAGIDPTNAPSEFALRRMLLSHGTGRLARRTLRLVGDKGDKHIELRKALVDFILEEIATWDGTLDESSLQEIEQVDRAPIYHQMVGLRICLEIDKLAKRVSLYLRFKTNRPFPDNGVEFNYKGRAYSCLETNPNWSSKLRDYEGGNYLDAAELDWLRGARFIDTENARVAVLKASPVKLFLSGRRENFDGWLESQRLERDCAFMIACHSSQVAVVEEWGRKSCEEFGSLSLEGLPEGWYFYAGKGSREPCNEIEALDLLDLIRLQLHGGIRIGRSNSYLRFAPPTIILEGCRGGERIIVTSGSYEQELEQHDKSLSRWNIPDNAPVGSPLDIKVYRAENDPLIYKVMQLVEPELSDELELAPKRNKSGDFIEGKDDGINARGAVIEGVDSSLLLDFPQVLPTYLSTKITFIGSRPGQVSEWPDDELPTEWNPIWALARVKKSSKPHWEVHFCGYWDQENIYLGPGSPVTDRGAVKRWVEAIWVRRKRISKEPNIMKLWELWNKYKKVAKTYA